MAQGAGGDGARAWAGAANTTGAVGAAGDAAAHRRADGAEPAVRTAESPRGNRQAREGARACGSYGSLEPSSERAQELAHRRRRRWQHAGGVALVVAALCLAASSEWSGSMGKGLRRSALAASVMDGEPDMIDAEKEPDRNPYCSVFADPSECEKQMQDGIYKTWSEDEVRQELWKTMKAMAELELREHSHHQEHKAKAEEQRKLFELFRKTMGREVMDIHALQDEMHTQHRNYMANLTRDLVDVAVQMKNYADTSLQDVNSRTTTLSSTQEEDSQTALVLIAEKVAQLKAKIAAFHAIVDTQSNTTQAFADGVKAAMLSGDSALEQALAGVDGRLDALSQREWDHWGNGTQRLDAHIAQQDAEHKAILSKTDTEVSTLRGEAHAALDSERAEIHAMLRDAMGEVRNRITWLRGNLTERAADLNQQVDAMIADQDRNNAEQAAAIAALRTDYEGNKTLAFQRLDNDDARLEQLFENLDLAQQTLRAQSAANKVFLLDQIDSNATRLEGEANAARAWMRTTIDAENASYVATQLDLDQWKAAMAAQRDADFAQLNTQIDGLISKEDAFLAARVQSDWAAFNARLAGAAQEGHEAVDEVNATARQRHEALVALEAEFERVQAENNRMQELAIEGLTSNLSETKGAVDTELQSLNARHAENTQALAVLQSELAKIRMDDNKDVAQRVAQELATLKTKLESDISNEHSMIRLKLHHDVQKLRKDMNLLKSMSGSEQDQVSSDLGYEKVDQEDMDHHSSTRLNGQETVIAKGETYLDGKINVLLSGLAGAKDKLASEMARIAAQRATDEAAWRSKIFNDANATQAREDARMEFLETSMTQELYESVTDLERLIGVQTVKTHTSFQHLTSTVVQLHAAQHKENKEQAAWLDTLTLAVHEATKTMEDDMEQLRNKLEETDTRLTQNTQELDDLQTSSINAINHTLYQDLDIVNITAHSTVLQDKLNAQEDMTTRFNAMRVRITQLGASINGTCDAQQQAVLALKDTFKRQNVERHNEMATLERDAAGTKTYLTRRLESIRQQILALKDVLAKDVEKRTSQQADMKADVATYMQTALDNSEAASKAALQASDARLYARLAAEVSKWTSVLQTNEAAAKAEAARLQALLDTFKTQEAEQHESVKSQVASMLRTVSDNQDAAEEAVATLRAGLADTDARLTSTSTDIRAMGSTDETLVRTEIAQGLEKLKADFSKSMEEQDAAMKEALRKRREQLEAQTAALEARLVAKWQVLNSTLAALQDQRVADAAFHNQEISDLLAQDREVRVTLRTSMDVMAQSLAAAQSAFQTSQNSVQTAENNGFKELLAKLNAAVQVLQGSGVKLGADVDEQVNNVTTRLRTMRAEIEDAQAALDNLQTSDKADVSEDVDSGLQRLKGSVVTTIESSMNTVRTSLNSRLSQLSTSINTVKTKAQTTEDSLKGRMATLEEKQSNDDAAQDRKISALLATYREMTARENARARELNDNITSVEKALNNGIAGLQNLRSTDKKEVVDKIEALVKQSQDALSAAIAGQQTALLQEVKQGVDTGEESVKTLETSRESAYSQDQTAIQNLQQEKNAELVALRNELQDLQASVEQLRRNLQTNTTGIGSALRQMVARVRAAQQELTNQQSADLQDFQRSTSQDVAELRANFTATLRADLQQREAYVSAHFADMSKQVDDRYQEPKSEVDKDEARIREISQGERERLAEGKQVLNSVNGTSMAWGNSMMQTLAGLGNRLSRGRQATDNSKHNIEQRLQQTKDRLAQLLRSAQDLEALKARLAAASTRAGEVQTKEGIDYTAADAQAREVDTQVGNWRTELQDALTQLREAVAAEEDRRIRDHSNITAVIASSRSRMKQIAVDIAALRRKAGQYVSSAPVPVAVSAPPAPLPATLPPPSPPPPPPPAPVVERPALTPGKTPPPQPILWWSMRSATQGVVHDEDTHKGVCLGDGVTGFLAGTVPLSSPGKWRVYLAAYAVEGGDTADTLQIVINGATVATFNNDPKSGFPCDGSTCLDKGGTYVADTVITGDKVDYTITWSSSTPVKAKHMYIGGGEAIFIGFPGAAPGPTGGAYSRDSMAVAMNAVDGKTVAKGQKQSDGEDKRGYEMATNPVLYVFDGMAVVLEKELPGGKYTIRKSELKMKGDGSRYTCVVYEAGMASYYSDECEVMVERKFKLPLSPILKPGHARFVLTWAAKPKDLDIYLLAPHHDPSQPACEVNWRNKKCTSGAVRLDRDDTQGHGPETISLESFNHGSYVVRIDEYRGNPQRPNWDLSHAMVTYYSPHLGATTMEVGQQGYVAGRVWYVMMVDGATRSVLPCTRDLCPERPAPRN